MQEKAKNLANIVYILQVIGIFTGITFIAGIIVNYIKRDAVKGTLVESHFRWQIRTFWYGLLWSVIGIILSVVMVGVIIIISEIIWVIYRIIKGWLALSDDKPMYQKKKKEIAATS